jgi:regulator of sigma E protease
MRGENGDDATPDSLGAKPPWQRLLILCGGPIANLALAVIVFIIAFQVGSPRGLTVVTKVQPRTPAAAAGLHVGDRILAVDGNEAPYADNLQTLIATHLGEAVVLTVQRGNHYLFPQLTPRLHHPAGQGALGIELAKTGTFRYGPVQSVRLAFVTVGTFVSSLPGAIASIGQHNGGSVSGPIGIADQTTQVVQAEPQYGFGTILFFIAVLSTSLGIMNLLPIPALDGGRILFVLVSWIRRRNLDPEVEGMIHLAGMAALLLLVLVVSYHDIVRWVTNGSS